MDLTYEYCLECLIKECKIGSNKKNKILAITNYIIENYYNELVILNEYCISDNKLGTKCSLKYNNANYTFDLIFKKADLGLDLLNLEWHGKTKEIIVLT